MNQRAIRQRDIRRSLCVQRTAYKGGIVCKQAVRNHRLAVAANGKAAAGHRGRVACENAISNGRAAVLDLKGCSAEPFSLGSLTVESPGPGSFGPSSSR